MVCSVLLVAEIEGRMFAAAGREESSGQYTSLPRGYAPAGTRTTKSRSVCNEN